MPDFPTTDPPPPTGDGDGHMGPDSSDDAAGAGRPSGPRDEHTRRRSADPDTRRRRRSASADSTPASDAPGTPEPPRPPVRPERPAGAGSDDTERNEVTRGRRLGPPPTPSGARSSFYDDEDDELIDDDELSAGGLGRDADDDYIDRDSDDRPMRRRPNMRPMAAFDAEPAPAPPPPPSEPTGFGDMPPPSSSLPDDELTFPTEQPDPFADDRDASQWGDESNWGAAGEATVPDARLDPPAASDTSVDNDPTAAYLPPDHLAFDEPTSAPADPFAKTAGDSFGDDAAANRLPGDSTAESPTPPVSVNHEEPLEPRDEIFRDRTKRIEPSSAEMTPGGTRRIDASVGDWTRDSEDPSAFSAEEPSSIVPDEGPLSVDEPDEPSGAADSDPDAPQPRPTEAPAAADADASESKEPTLLTTYSFGPIVVEASEPHSPMEHSDSDIEVESDDEQPAPTLPALGGSDGSGGSGGSGGGGTGGGGDEDGDNRRLSPFLAGVVARPVAVLVLMVAVCTFGAISYDQLPLELLPDVSYPRLTIRTEYPSAPPVRVEQSVSKAIEEGIGSVPDLESKSSISRSEESEVTLQFRWGTDLARAATEVRQKLDRVSLPGDAEAPLVLRYDPSLEPVMRLSLAADGSVDDAALGRTEMDRQVELRTIAEKTFKPALESLDGVAAVNILGGSESEVRVWVDEQKMAAYGVEMSEVAAQIQANNIDQPAGIVSEAGQEYLVRALNQFETIDDIRNIPVRPNVPLHAVARVELTEKDPEIRTRLNGRMSVELEILKEADSNLVRVAEAVWQRLYGDDIRDGLPQWRVLRDARGRATFVRSEIVVENPYAAQDEESSSSRWGGSRVAAEQQITEPLAALLPPGVGVNVLTDQSFFIEDANRELQSTAIVGGALAILVLLIFLRSLVATVLVAIAIPVSVLATFTPMRLSEVSLNLMSFGGLALGLGMLVDNAIVVLESITRCREEGDSARRAAIRGVSEVFGAVVASTTTTVVVFLPIVFVDGVAGQLFGDQALTIVFSLVCSLFVATLVIPVIAALLGGRLSGDEKSDRVAEIRAIASRVLRPRFVRLWRRWAWNIMAGASWNGIRTWFGARPIIPPADLRRSGEEPQTDEPEPMTILRWTATPVVLPLLIVSAVLGIVLGLVEAIVGTAAEIIWRYLVLAPLLLALTLIVAPFQVVRGIVGVVFWPLLRAFDTGFNSLIIGYRRVLRSCITYPGLTLTATAVVAGLAFYIGGSLQQELLPKLQQGQFTVQVSLPEGRGLNQTAFALTDLERAVEPFTVGDGAIVERFTVLAGESRDAAGERVRRRNLGRVTVVMTRTASSNDEIQVQEAIQRAVANSPDMRDPDVRVPTLFTLSNPLEIEVVGLRNPSDVQLDQMRAMSEAIERALLSLTQANAGPDAGMEAGVQERAVGPQFSRGAGEQLQAADRPMFSEVRSTVRTGSPELRVRFDAVRLDQAGLTAQEAAEMLSNAIEGSVATEFTLSDTAVDVRVVLDERERPSWQEMLNLPLTEGLTLGEAVRVESTLGPAEIRHRGNLRVAVVNAVPADGVSLSAAEAAVRGIVQQFNGQSDAIAVRLAGQAEERNQSFNQLAFAMAMAVFLVFVVLAVQFESVLQPFLILLTVPLALVGVIGVLWVLQIPVGVVVIIGTIVLAGIVVNNAIVLIDRINYHRRLGMPLEDAIVEGGAVRLRPVLITALTTILALIPLTGWIDEPLKAMQVLDLFGEGKEIRQPMAVAIVGGLTISTALTLLVVPTAYRLLGGSIGSSSTDES